MAVSYTHLDVYKRQVLCSGCVELMYLVALWGRRHGIRVIVDVIDLWPDLFVLALPANMRRFGRLLFAPWFYLSQRTYVYAAHVTSVSKAVSYTHLFG